MHLLHDIFNRGLIQKRRETIVSRYFSQLTLGLNNNFVFIYGHIGPHNKIRLGVYNGSEQNSNDRNLCQPL